MSFQPEVLTSASNKHRLYVDDISFPVTLIFDKRVTWNEKFLIVVINMFDRKHHCYMSNATLAEFVEMTEQSVVNALGKLKKLGWVSTVDWRDGERRLTTRLREARRALEQPLQPEDAPTNLSLDPNYSKLDAPTNLSSSYINPKNELEREERLLQIFRERFPTYIPSPFQQDQIYMTVEDVDLWVECCDYWAGNAHQPRSINKLLDMYMQRLEVKMTPSLSNTRVVIDDFNSGYCASCSNGFKHLCPEHREDK